MSHQVQLKFHLKIKMQLSIMEPRTPLQFHQLPKLSEINESQNTGTHFERPELIGFINSLSHIPNLETSNDLQTLFWIFHIFSDPKEKNKDKKKNPTV